MGQLNKKSILLVEDEALIALAEQGTLKKFGYRVFTACSGEEAIGTFKNNIIDLILMDIDLGKGIDGTETAELILRQRELPIVFLSSHAEPEIIEKTERITSYGFIVKNSDATVLDVSIKMAFKLFEANRGIREKEKLLFSIAENYPNSYVSIIEQDYTIGFTSGREFKKQNLDPDKLIGQKIDQVFGRYADRIKKYLKKTFSGEECSFELDIYGEYQHHRSLPLYSEDGNIRQVLLVVENITDRRLAEEALRESENKFSKTFHSAPTLIAISRLEDGEFIDVNQAFLNVTGFSREEVIGHNSIELQMFSPADRERLKKLINQKGLFNNEEFIIRKKSGEMINTLFSAQLIEMSGRQCLISVVENITKRKQTENSLKESEEKFRLITEQSLFGISILQDGKYIYSNEATEKITGFSYDEIKDWAPKDFLQLIHPEDLPTVREEVRKKFDDGYDAVSYYTYRIIDKSGNLKWIENYSRAIEYRGKRADLILFADITERKKAEKALEKSLEGNRFLLAELQHRAKNSFAMISSMISLVANTSQSRETRRALSEAGSWIKAVSELYNMLDASGSVTEVSLNEYLIRLVSFLSNISGNIVIQYTFEEVIVPVKTAVPVGILIVELITNSIKHAFPDGREGSITLNLKKLKKGACIDVKDNGFGLPENFDISEAESLGLTIVRSLVEQIQGTLNVKIDNGTSFEIKIPLE